MPVHTEAATARRAQRDREADGGPVWAATWWVCTQVWSLASSPEDWQSVERSCEGNSAYGIDRLMLIIVESPTKAKKIQSILKQRAMSTVGHFKDLPAAEIGVDLKTYEPTFVYHERKMHLPNELVT